jgi:hypothetical protein
MVKELESDGQKLTQFKAQVRAAPGVRVQGILSEAGQSVKKLADKWKNSYAKKVFDNLCEISSDARLNEPIDITNILNASFLVDKGKEKDFENRLYKLDEQYGDKLIFKYVTPVPPYNFLRLQLNW